MNCVSIKQWVALVGCAIAAVVSQPAIAAQSWNFGDTENGTGTPVTADGGTTAMGCVRGANVGNSDKCNASSGSNQLTLTGWGTTALTSSASTYAAAYLSNQGTKGIGLTSQQPVGGTNGMESTADPNHMIDSIGNSELVSLSFINAVKLQTVTLGYTGADADFSLLAWTKGGTPTAVNGLTPTSLLASGWTFVQQVTSAAASTATAQTLTVNSGGVSSSYWLIAAFNSAYITGGAASQFDSVGDAWKLLAVSAVNGTVPEPTSLALVGLALIGTIGARRVKKISA